jgi:hypothetical protein
MSKPADFPVAATDASYPAGAEPWSATDTKTEPTSGRQTEGYEPGAHLPAQEFNWYLNLLYLWIVWFDAYNTTNTKTKHIGALNAVATDSTSVWDQTSLDAWGAIVETPLGDRIFALDVPVGSTIKEIRARVKDNVTGPTLLQLTSLRATDETPTTIGTTQTSSGAGSWQTLTQTGLTEITVAGRNYQSRIATSSGAAEGKVAWIEIDYLPPPT